jgi:hypothetical protein
MVTGKRIRQDLHSWLSPPDSSTNHNIACNAHHEGTATWFFQGSMFEEWRSTPSLLWIHGKRMLPSLFTAYHLLDLCSYSGLRQECALVSSFSMVIKMVG